MSQITPARVVKLRHRQQGPLPRASAVGFPGSTLDAYHLLAERGEQTLAELAGQLCLSWDQTRATIAELAGLKLIRQTPSGGLVAVPGSQAIDDLLAEQAVMLARAVESMAEGHRRLRTVTGNRAVLDPEEASRISSTMLGAGQLGMFELPGEAADTICSLHPGGSFSEELLARSLARAKEHLRRNVRMQVVHQTSALRHPSVATYLTELAALGCRVRLRDSLPFRMLLIDQTSAVCAVPTSGSYLLRGDRVIVLLNRIFETTWVDATPLDAVLPGRASVSPEPVDRPPVAKNQPIPLASTHEAVLRLLAEGHTDQSIARAMGITTRTVGRRISEIYHLLGVQSRFQAGIRARELGIV